MKKILLPILFSLSAMSAAYAKPSTLVYNLNTNSIEQSENANEVRPMASITKLMTAMVILDFHSVDQVICTKSGTVHIKNLLERLLIRSDNSAAEALSKLYPGGRSEFIRQMNIKAETLGLHQTRFEDPSGIGAGNITTATELVEIVRAAGRFPAIRDIASRPELTLPVRVVKTIKTKIAKHSKKKHYAQKYQVVRETIVSLPNTNHDILYEFSEVALSKTGTTSKAGRCLAMLVKKLDQEYVIIILGQPNKAARDRRARDLIINEVKLKET